MFQLILRRAQGNTHVRLRGGLGLAELEEHDVSVRQRHAQPPRLRAQRHLLDAQRALLLPAAAPLEH